MARLQFADSFLKTVGRLGLAILVAASAVAARGDVPWLTDYTEALAVSQETGRPVLAIFTGSDWCQHCRTLERNVLETDTFQTWAHGHVVPLLVDLPQDGISLDERKSRSRVCIRYGVRAFPSAVLVAPDGAKIAALSGYQGQEAADWVATLAGHLPEQGVADAGRVHSSLDQAVASARDAKRPVLVMVSRASDAGATTRLASLLRNPEFESLAREHFVVARLPTAGEQAEGSTDQAAVDELLGGETPPAESAGIVVTDDGHTPLHVESADQEPGRVVSGLRRFLANRQASRSARR